ncbi:hypothetical protein VNI00_007113 [Paramarasmius palmivorus]|uniref:Uncharacterized protein n=1 Tax=Paramarasmius palmivorus TaxID=297713 RepID=A0AAW0D3A9_9AGAR
METPVPKDRSPIDNAPRQRYGLSAYINLSTFLRICLVYLLFMNYPFAIFTTIYDTLYLKYSVDAPSDIHQNQTWAEVVASGTQSAVVRPLFGKKQEFDVEVTVWRRRTAEERDMAWRQWETDLTKIGDQWEEYDLDNAYDVLYEKPIFSDIVFRGLRLKDGVDVFASIPLQIPSEIFLNEHVSTSDIRASIVLIPSSPSLLDHVSDYSSWYSPWMRRPRMRALSSNYTFPLARTMKDRVLESFALSEQIDALDSDNGGSDSGQENCVGMFANGTIYRADPSYTIHPHIISRTHIRISKQASLLNHENLNKAHQLLKSFAHKLCTQPRVRYLYNKPSWISCDRQYMFSGHWETLVKLQPSNIDSKKGQDVEWAYTPYLDNLLGVAFPDERIPAPVSREKCGRKNGEIKIEGRGVVDFTWHLSLTATSLSEMSLGDGMSPLLEKDLQKTTISDNVAYNAVYMNAMAGHRRDNARTLLKFAWNIAGYSIDVVILILKNVYWRHAGERDSFQGASFLALYHLYEGIWPSDILLHVKMAHLGNLHMILGITLLLAIRYTFHPHLAGVGSSGIRRWIPVIKLNIGSRPESTITSLMAIMVCSDDIHYYSRINMTLLELFIVTLGLSHTIFQGCFLVRPGPRVKTHLLRPVVPFSAWLTGKLCQLDLNMQTGVFAGDYKVTVLAEVLREIIDLVLLSERVVGTDEWRQGISVMDGLRLVVLAVAAWQAMWLPQRRQEKVAVLDATEDQELQSPKDTKPTG